MVQLNGLAMVALKLARNASIRCLRWSLEMKLPRRSSFRTRMEPDLKLVDPRRMLRREVEHDAMAGVAQECLAARHRGQHAGLALLAQIIGDMAQPCHQSDHAFREMRVEVVADHVPARARRASGKQLFEERHIVRSRCDCRRQCRTPGRWRHRMPRSAPACRAGRIRTPAVRHDRASWASSPPPAPMPECRSFRRSIQSAPLARAPPVPLGRQRRRRRTWRQTRDQALASASNGCDAA
jgi:hypothetical protein